jgi:hypothetical protein
MAIPGVAIATALMPPLCTAGFGLATANWSFFFGAFYLYGLNAVFIALSTFVVVRVLRFPHHEYATPDERSRERRLVAVVTLAAALPSAWFLYDVAMDLRMQRRIGAFLRQEVEAPGRAVPQWERRPDPAGDVLRIYVAGHPIERNRMDSLQAAVERHGLDGVRLEVVQSDISADDLRQLRGEVQREILQAVMTTSAARDSLWQARQRQDTVRLSAAARELAGAFPEIVELAYAPRANLLAPDSLDPGPVVFVAFAPRTPAGTRRDIVARSEALLRERLGLSTLTVRPR